MSRVNELLDVRIVFTLFLVLIIIALVLTHFVFLLIVFKKTLHSPANLLICNACLASILYFIVSTIQVCLFYTGSILSDWRCRILAYFSYGFMYLVCYSYVIQALSRLFCIVFHEQRYFLQYRFHLILIACQTLISFLSPLSILITKDVVFRSQRMCFVSPSKVLQVAAFSVSSQITSLGIIVIIYMIIYCRVIRSSSSSTRLSSRETNRDLQLIRNILILFLAFFSSGTPFIIYIIITYTIHSSSLGVYLMPLLGPPFAVAIEKICLILLNQDIRKATRKVLEDLHLIRPSSHDTDQTFPIIPLNNIRVHAEIVNKADKHESIIIVS